jgi:2-iminobutanoate/2-iminopropanoate deaminase
MEEEQTKRIVTKNSFSKAVGVGDFVFAGFHRGGGESFAEQLDGAIESLRATLDQFDVPLSSLVKVNVWLRDIEDLLEMEKRFFHYFGENQFPARMTSTTQFIDSDCLVMIDGVAYRAEETRE